jgi:YhgE/Pip-like protein
MSSGPPQSSASRLLKVPAVWTVPAVLGSTVVVLMSALYLAAVVDPARHLSGLPVSVVNQDAGATIGSRHVNSGQQVVSGLLDSRAVSTRLGLKPSTMAAARESMDTGRSYATVVIAPAFTASLMAISGLPATVSNPGKPTIQILTNQRAGTEGVGLATGVLQPALRQASRQIGLQLLAVAASRGAAHAPTDVLLADPIALSTVPYRPLPAHAGLGLSAFYVSLLTMLIGFLGATIVNSSVDAALGYAATEIGPRWTQRQPVAISRWQTLLAKWVIAVVLTAALCGLMLLVAVGVLGMDAPSVGYLWLFTWFASATVAAGTLVLFAVLGAPGQLVALLLFVYLGLASAGGTVPLQALPGSLKAVSNVDPLRQILEGVRAILYFDARGDAGLTRGLLTTGAGMVFWLAVGAIVITAYDRRGLFRLRPETLAYVDDAVRAHHDQSGDREGPGAHTQPPQA